ncbi:MAG: hypothetical protein N2Z21_03740, partial [Candidatus Sumerlaeaceae bacterium]|nr:hypothetical protein [Candidatus Sumerlaeaceae bacterium]
MFSRWLPATMSLRLTQRGHAKFSDTLCEMVCFIGIISLHVVYYLLCLRKGSVDPGVDGEVYRELANAYLSSQTILGEKCTVLFWTPWYVFIALVGGHQTGVFFLQLAAFAGTLLALRSAAERLQLSMVWRMAVVMAYGLYWPTFDYVIFYQYENFLAWGVATVVCLLGVNRDILYRSAGRWLAIGVV